jgi:hypothetical protein
MSLPMRTICAENAGGIQFIFFGALNLYARMPYIRSNDRPFIGEERERIASGSLRIQDG